MAELFDRNGKRLYLGAFVLIHDLSDSNEFGEFENNRKSSLGRIAKVKQITASNPGVYWYPDLEIELDYRMIKKEGVCSMSMGAFGDQLEIIDSNKSIEMLYDDDIWNYINNYDDEQSTEYFKMLVNKLGYSS